MAANTMLEVQHLCKQYGKGEQAIRALDDVSFTVQRGEFVAVTGESGGGKTTLLNALGSLIPVDSGTIIADGRDVTAFREEQAAAYRRRQIGFIFQSYELIPVLNVEENILLPLRLDSTQPDMDYLEELLELTGLESRRQSFPHELSGGQQQRAAFARALVHKPELILADEPTGNLDTRNSRELISILKTTIRKRSQTLVLITHDLSIAAQADRIFRMTDGRLTEEGRVKQP